MLLKTVLANVSVQFIGRIISSALAFFTTLIIARLLGIELYGIYTTIMAFVVLFYLLIDFGINTVFLKELSQTQDVTLFQRSLLGLRLTLSLFVALIANGVAVLLSFFHPAFTPQTVVGVFVTSPLLIGYGLLLSYTAFFQYRLAYRSVVVSTIVGALATAVAVGASFYLSLVGVIALYWVLGATVVGMTLNVVCIIFFARNFARLRPHYNKLLWKTMVQKSLPLAIVLICNVVYFRVDLFLLGYFRSTAEIGAYGLAYKFFEFAIVIPTFVMNSLYPLLLRQNTPNRAIVLKKTMFVLTACASICALLLWYFAQFLPLIKVEFSASVPLLRLLALSVPVFFLTSPLMWLFVLAERQKELLLVYGTGLIVNCMLNVLFIPEYGAAAAAVTTGISETAIVITGYLLYKRKELI